MKKILIFSSGGEKGLKSDNLGVGEVFSEGIFMKQCK